MQSKNSKSSSVSLAKESFGETTIDAEERELIVDSIGLLLAMIHNNRVEINGDPVFTKHVCKQLTQLGVRLQYEGATEKEIN